MKPLFVGQAPSRTAGRVRAFDGASGARLAALLGLSREEFLARFDTANVLARWPGKHGGRLPYREKGDRFPLGLARRRAARLLPLLRGRPLVVLCGRRVALAFGVEAEFLSRVRVEGAPALVLPHPSGVNLWWNSPENRARAAEALRELAGAA